jgi:hypothetical protein
MIFNFMNSRLEKEGPTVSGLLAISQRANMLMFYKSWGARGPVSSVPV